MKKQLFNLNDDRECYTPLAMEYDEEFLNALRPIFEKAKKDNLSIREIQYIANGAMTEIALAILIGWDVSAPKPEPISIIESGLVGELLRAPAKVDECYPVDPHDK